MHVRCDNACAKGIPMPGLLRAASRRRRLDQAAQQPDNEMWQSRLEEAGEEATKRAQATHGDDVTFTCNNGGVEGGNELKKTAMVQFAWRAGAGEFNEEHTAHVRCDNACAKGIPLPGPLRAALRRRRLGPAAQPNAPLSRISCFRCLKCWRGALFVSPNALLSKTSRFRGLKCERGAHSRITQSTPMEDFALQISKMRALCLFRIAKGAASAG